MGDEARQRQIEVARALEKRGQTDAAVQAWSAAGAPEEAARLLAAARRFAEAAALLEQSLGVPAADAGKLDPAGRKRALSAAIFWARAGEGARAVPLYLALGERARAAELLAKAGDLVGAAKLAGAAKPAGPVPAVPTPAPAGAQTALSALQTARNLEAAGRHQLALESYVQARDWASAGRMALALGRARDAADLFSQAGMAWETAACWHRAGEPAKALEWLVRVPRDDARYRKACAQAISIAGTLGAIDFQLEIFLQQWLADAPKDELEIEALYGLGRLYQQHDFPENARDAYRKVLAARPQHTDAAQRLATLDTEARGTPLLYEKILREELAFRERTGPLPAPGAGTLPALPDLPSLPAVPDAPTAGAVPTAGPLPMVAANPMPTHAVQLAPAPRGSPLPPAPGQVFAERYRIEAKIGQGGMAVVYRAVDLELNEQVAIKVFTRPVEDPQLLARFKQELTLSRKLNHPNILRLYDIGAVEGCRYITMELLAGTDLKAKLGRPLPLATGLDYLLQACAALAHAHERGVVHRDIKPANLFLTNDGVLKLMDFGIAKRQEAPGLTIAGTIAGTPEYMSPEQINGFEKVGASTDLYALGVMAYQFFTGQVPFRHPEIMPLLVMHVKQVPRPPRELNPQIPPPLEAVILKLLEKEPEKRFSDCRSLAKALTEIKARVARV